MATKIPSNCPECNGTLTTRGGETTCSDCGLVVSEERIDPGPEWRSFEDERTDRRRTGAPLSRSRHDYGLSTEIGYSGSNRASGRKRRLYARLRRQHKRSHCRSKAERNRRDVFMQIRRLTAALSLPDSIRDQACTLFRSAQEARIVTGRSLEGFTAATVYAACRVHGVSRIRAEVLEASRASRSELDAAYGAMDRELGLPVGPLDPDEYIPRFGTRLDLSVEVRNRGSELLESAVESELIGGHNPAGVAAACLYTAAKEREADVTQKQAAAVADVSPPTIRVTYQALREAELVG
ncbi:transcription initiation factor IIB [Halalkalicoccus jeotgali]|uniref:Transcription initiation factor TFB n=1 Tax=Halalkalicoccus jeotgali (strain DSM 18796 / CECT 7217 / JCM 14584 / KCTC 4019 / B3) TaxID=795797 RepID=D8J3V9_HALJB|nr:transcription initiation factor IIB family protein [Halalkalicoccus jeotgali]ADJ13450.1 transcription initiation factor TFB [Halalkalicoccus jeotgali B3]ELY33075.1 transcription initiation factor TFB [Halalkalicoccus jeotgali B3]